LARLGFGKSVGRGAGKQLFFRVFKWNAGVTELAGGVKQFGIAHALWRTPLEIVEGAPGQRERG
jgi:hypothetical protein